MKRFDKLDNEIITVLKKEKMISPNATTIAKELGKPVATIHSRLKRLEKKRIIMGYGPIIDYKKTGEEITSFLLLQVPIGKDIDEFAEGLRKFKEVVQIDYVVGEWAFICKVRAKNMEDYTKIMSGLNKQMQPPRIEDIISLKTYKKEI